MELLLRNQVLPGMHVSPCTAQGDPLFIDNRGEPPVLRATDDRLPSWIQFVSFIPVAGGRAHEAAMFLNSVRIDDGIWFCIIERNGFK